MSSRFGLFNTIEKAAAGGKPSRFGFENRVRHPVPESGGGTSFFTFSRVLYILFSEIPVIQFIGPQV